MDKITKEYLDRASEIIGDRKRYRDTDQGKSSRPAELTTDCQLCVIGNN